MYVHIGHQRVRQHRHGPCPEQGRRSRRGCDTYIHVYVYTCIHIYIYIYIHTHTYTHISLSLSLSLYIYMCIYIYIYMYVYTHTYVYNFPIVLSQSRGRTADSGCSSGTVHFSLDILRVAGFPTSSSEPPCHFPESESADWL